MAIVTRNINPAPRKLKKIDDEKWRKIADSNGLYKVSNYGRVKSYQNDKEGQILNGSLLGGYKRVQITINGVRRRVLVHRLVAETWIKKPSKLCTTVIHKDWSKKNNQVDNLEWVTLKDMRQRMFDEYRDRKAKRPKKIMIVNSKINEEQVKQLKSYIELGFSQVTVSRMFNISATQVKRIMIGENWSHVQIEKNE